MSFECRLVFHAPTVSHEPSSLSTSDLPEDEHAQRVQIIQQIATNPEKLKSNGIALHEHMSTEYLGNQQVPGHSGMCARIGPPLTKAQLISSRYFLVDLGSELELIQTQMTQKPMLRAEVYAHAMRASRNRK